MEATLTGAPADPEAVTVDCMAVGPDGRRRVYERIVQHLEAGGGVAVRLYHRNELYLPPHRWWFRVDDAGSLYGRRGCLDFAAITFSDNFPFAKKGGRKR